MSDSAPQEDATSSPFALTTEEVRVLGVLIEKAFLTPDVYPLSVNGLVTGCNQLTGREPVLQLTESQVQDALDSLIAQRWATRRDQAGARVAKYEHLVRMRHSLPQPEQAVLAILLLRGPQTAGEIRQRIERLHAFADTAAVESVLEHLADKFPSLARQLPRAPGTKEPRWAHLLAGEPDLDSLGETDARMAASGGLASRVAALEAEVQALREELTAFRKQFD
ncbi:MAG: YceH family protein [Zoogloeaceae bacterium]|nr:YceH family protein [Zoogloeaceae bacterium]